MGALHEVASEGKTRQTQAFIVINGGLVFY